MTNQEKGDGALIGHKATNHVHHFPLTWFSIRFWLFRFSLVVWLLSDVSHSDECRTKKYFQYAENMIPLFLAILMNLIIIHIFLNEDMHFFMLYY